MAVLEIFLQPSKDLFFMPLYQNVLEESFMLYFWVYSLLTHEKLQNVLHKHLLKKCKFQSLSLADNLTVHVSLCRNFAQQVVLHKDSWVYKNEPSFYRGKALLPHCLAVKAVRLFQRVIELQQKLWCVMKIMRKKFQRNISWLESVVNKQWTRSIEDKRFALKNPFKYKFASWFS